MLVKENVKGGKGKVLFFPPISIGRKTYQVLVLKDATIGEHCHTEDEEKYFVCGNAKITGNNPCTKGQCHSLSASSLSVVLSVKNRIE